jgi:shikimate dehydrogenase
MSHVDRFLLAGVIGWPIMHSRSPMLHNHWFKKNNLVGRYIPLAIEPKNLEGALRGLHPLGFSGVNVTIPHKQAVIPYLDEVSIAAQKIGAVSCIHARSDGALIGSNNDAHGFIRNVKVSFPHWRADEGPITVIGAGGGARAVCYGLLEEGAKEIRLVNRSLEKAQAIASDLGSGIVPTSWALDLNLQDLSKDALVSDIVYVPLETELLKAARLRGNPTLNGLGMLLHQGPLAWKVWFGIEPEVTQELRAILEKSITG